MFPYTLPAETDRFARSVALNYAISHLLKPVFCHFTVMQTSAGKMEAPNRCISRFCNFPELFVTFAPQLEKRAPINLIFSVNCHFGSKILEASMSTDMRLDHSEFHFKTLHLRFSNRVTKSTYFCALNTKKITVCLETSCISGDRDWVIRARPGRTEGATMCGIAR